MADLGMFNQISSSTMDISAQRAGERGGIPPSDRTAKNNQGGIIPNIDYFSFKPFVYTFRLVKRQYIQVYQERAPDDPRFNNFRSYILLNNFCLSAYLREVDTWVGTTNPTTPTFKMKKNTEVLANFPYVRFGKLNMRLSNFIPVINSVNTANASSIATINPAPWMCIAMDTRGTHRKVKIGVQTIGQGSGWRRLLTINGIPIENSNLCSQWSHVETLQMGQIWTYEQDFMNDAERWWINPILQDAQFLQSATEKNVFMLPSNTIPPDVGTSWWNPVYPANDANTYHAATPLPPVAIYVPYIGGLDQADNDPQISGSVTLETSLELHFCSYVEPFDISEELDTSIIDGMNLQTQNFNNTQFLYFNTFIHQ